MSLVNTRYGSMQIIDEDSIISRSLNVYGEWAENEIKVISQFIKKNGIILDIGAFIGTHALAFSHYVGKYGRVYTVEPRREIFNFLAQNIAINAITNITPINAGISNQRGKMTLEALPMTHGNFGGLELSTKLVASKETYDIDILTIDSLNLTAVQLIKLDVEGMEVQVLMGAIETISRDKPIIFAECNSLTHGAKLLDFAHQNDYLIYACLTDAYNQDNFKHISDNFFGDAKELSLVFVPKTQQEEWSDTLKDLSLPLLTNIDELALVSLHKPQYIHEILDPYIRTYSSIYRGRKWQGLAEIKELAVDNKEKWLHINEALRTAQQFSLERLEQVELLDKRLNETDEALRTAQQFSLERLEQVELLDKRLNETDEALRTAQQFSLERLEQVELLDKRLNETDEALRTAQQLSLGRLEQVELLDKRLNETDEALRTAQQLSLGRLEQVELLDKRLNETDEALRTAQQFSLERLEQVELLDKRLNETDEALRTAQQLSLERLEQVELLDKRLNEAKSDLRVAEQQAQNHCHKIMELESNFRALEKH